MPDAPELTPLGLGAWAMGGGDWVWGWGAQDDAQSIATIRHAARRGIGWVDTAASYGLGHGEEVVGRALRQLPAGERPLVLTKGGSAWAEGDRATRRVGDRASILAHCDASLRRLGLDCVDVYQLHWPSDDGTPVEETWQAMAELVETGKARWIGVCNFDVELLERCEAIRHVDVLQTPLSLIDRRACADVVGWGRRNSTAVLAYSPMASGLLTGRFSAERVAALDRGDWRREDPDFQPPALERNLALVARLTEIAARRGRSVGELALAWVLAAGATAAIAGARSPEQVDGWAAAADLRLDADELEAIAAALAQSGAGRGPVAQASREQRELLADRRVIAERGRDTAGDG